MEAAPAADDPAPARLRAVVAYDGTAFHGFQFQRDLPTIGGTLETALAAVFGRPTPVAAAGRTDTGVHASGQVVSFPAPARFPPERLTLALRGRLPAAISVHEPRAVAAGWSARFAARERRYVYLLDVGRERDALRARFCGHEPRPLDVPAMRRAFEALRGRRDFRSLCGTPPKNGTVRTVTAAALERVDPGTLRFEIAADGFLHHMVRVAVGTIVEIGRGARPEADLGRILDLRDRRAAGHTASGAGLYLAGVRYDDFDSFREPWPSPLARPS